MMNFNRLFGLDYSDLLELYPNHWLHKDAANAIKQLQRLALQQGFDLRLASSYRSFSRQLQIWNEKYQGMRPCYDPLGQEIKMHILPPLERIKAICHFTAIPGTSRHHWGTDIDIYDANAITRSELQLIEPEYNSNGPCGPMHDWLQTSALELGFIYPYTELNQLDIANEPWHLSFQTVARPYQQMLCPALWIKQMQTQNLEFMGLQTLTKHIDNLFELYVYNE
jgi:LAS superfamily LD-carboxypeptidase LdcB